MKTIKPLHNNMYYIIFTVTNSKTSDTADERMSVHDVNINHEMVEVQQNPSYVSLETTIKHSESHLYSNI